MDAMQWLAGPVAVENDLLTRLMQPRRMKALLLSLLVVIGLDEALDHGAGVTGCYLLVADLVHGTAREVGQSVYRR